MAYLSGSGVCMQREMLGHLGVLALASGQPVGSRQGAVVKSNVLNATEVFIYKHHSL